MNDTDTEKRYRNWLLPMIVVLGLVLLCVVGSAEYFAWVNRTRPAAQVFYEKAVAELQPGASIADVKQLFGDSKLLTRDDVPGWVTSIIVDPRCSKYNPDGIESTDKFLYYPVADRNGNIDEWYLQFRNNRLVNFDPKDYPTAYAESRKGILGLSL
jgi:hypothetical protein